MLANKYNKKKIRDIFLRIIFSLSFSNRLLNQRRKSVYFLTYHSISTPSPVISADLGLCVSPEVFKSHMKYISTYCNPVSILDAEEIISGNRDPVKNAVVVTFDDGYRDNFTHALPVLKKYGVPATIFVITGIVGTDKRPWLIDLYFDIFQSQCQEILFDIPKTGQHFKFYLRNDVEKYALMVKLRKILKNMSGCDRSYVVNLLKEQLQSKCCSLNLEHLKMLNWDEIALLKKEGIIFGSHSVNHLILDNEDDGTLFFEVMDSKKKLENHIGAEVTTFAYPGNSGGGFSMRTEKMIKKAGYKSAYLFSTGTSFNDLGSNMYRLNRGEVLGTHWELAGELSKFLTKCRNLRRFV